MATAGVIVLSSSPARSCIRTTPPRTLLSDISSSPALPSPSQLITKRGLSLASGSKINPLPSGSTTGFTRASGPLHDDAAVAQATRDAGVNTITTARHQVPTKPRKATAQNLLVSEHTGKPRKVRKSTVSVYNENHGGVINEGTNEQETIAKPPKVKRTRSIKDSSSKQTTIKGNKITKPSTNDKGVKKGRPKASFQTLVTGQDPRHGPGHVSRCETRDEGIDLGSSEAVGRRMDWTPPKDTEVPCNTERKPRITSSDLSSKSVFHIETGLKQFVNLLSDYGYAQLQDIADVDRGVSRRASGESLTKRRKLELTKPVTCDPPVIREKRSKSPRKKAQTITDKATAPFVAEDTSSAPSLLQYFNLEPPVADPSPASDDLNVQELGACQRQRSPLTRPRYKKTDTKSKKVTQAPPILSPETVQKAAGAQELVFGTSSQLARDESPSFLRDLQIAIKSSEAIDEGLHTGGNNITSSLQVRSLSTADTASSRSLWTVGARDLEGSLLDADIVDLSVTPIVKHTVHPPLSKPISKTATIHSAPGQSLGQKIESNDDWKTIDESSLRETASVARESKSDVSSYTHSMLENKIPRSMAEASCRKRPKRLFPVKISGACKPTISTALQIANPDMPGYQGFSTFQLTKAVASYGFKPIKSRDQMIALLQKCWESKNRIALQSLPTNTVPQSPIHTTDSTHDSIKPTVLVKKRGRPPKPKAATSKSKEDAEIDTKSEENQRGKPKKDATRTSSPLKTQVIAQKSPPTPPVTQSAQLNPKRIKPKRKVAPVEEISDSDTSPTPSPPRHSSPKTPKALSLAAPSLSQQSSTPTNLTPNSAQTHFLSKITLAITSYPPMHDPKNLTWYEKMLLYDPIVLEDLTRWLNVEGLGRVGVDEEVGTGVVKAWCERKGICCLWRENLRGGVRARW